MSTANIKVYTMDAEIAFHFHDATADKKDGLASCDMKSLPAYIVARIVLASRDPTRHALLPSEVSTATHLFQYATCCEMWFQYCSKLTLDCNTKWAHDLFVARDWLLKGKLTIVSKISDTTQQARSHTVLEIEFPADEKTAPKPNDDNNNFISVPYYNLVRTWLWQLPGSDKKSKEGRVFTYTLPRSEYTSSGAIRDRVIQFVDLYKQKVCPNGPLETNWNNNGSLTPISFQSLTNIDNNINMDTSIDIHV